MTNDLTLDKSVSNFAVFGNPIQHSKSPQIHSLFADQTGIILSYQAVEVPLDGFQEYVNTFAEQGGKGLNITVPFKEEAFHHCTFLSPRAEKAGSVNTIKFDAQSNPHGDTTDGQGLINDLTQNHNIEISGKSVLVLGAGGSVKAILEPLLEKEPAKVSIANRTVLKAKQLAESFSASGTVEAFAYGEIPEQTYDLIINGTSLSLQGELPPVPKDVINDKTCCYDLMYSDGATVFMQWASENGAAIVVDGLGMLVEQAAESFFIWNGVKPETAPVIKALRNVKS